MLELYGFKAIHQQERRKRVLLVLMLQNLFVMTPEEIEPHSDSATWIGENYYDPTGATIVGYEWTLIQEPLGSSSFIPNGGANRPEFFT